MEKMPVKQNIRLSN